jgi:hypothetical protein
MKIGNVRKHLAVRCHAAETGKAREEGKITRKTSVIKTFLDLATEAVSETRMASDSRVRQLGEVAALRGRMQDRTILEHLP